MNTNTQFVSGMDASAQKTDFKPHKSVGRNSKSRKSEAFRQRVGVKQLREECIKVEKRLGIFNSSNLLIEDCFKARELVLQPTAIPLPIATRGVGFATSVEYSRMCTTWNVSAIVEICTIHQYYRVALYLAFYKMYLCRYEQNETPSFSVVTPFVLSEEVTQLLAPIGQVPLATYNILASIGHVDGSSCIWHSVPVQDLPDDGEAYALYLYPTNIRSILTALASNDPEGGPGRDLFYSLNPIPGSTWRQVNGHWSITNDNDIWPAEYATQNLANDIHCYQNLLTRVAGRLPASFISDFEWSGKGNRAATVSMDPVPIALRIKQSRTSNQQRASRRRDACGNHIRVVFNASIYAYVGDDMENSTTVVPTWSPEGEITNMEFITGAASFVGEHVTRPTRLEIQGRKKMQIAPGSMLFRLVDLIKFNKHIAMSQESSSTEDGFRLSQNVKPVFYDLYLKPDLDKGTFEGRVSIFIYVTDKQKLITLHQKDLNISEVSLMPISLVKLEIKESFANEKDETFTIVPKEELTDVTYHLNLSFSGSLSDKIVGFYSSRYKDEENKTRIIATSKFEPTYARRAFPCFDEPEFKAEFNITLVHPSDKFYNALSNMNIKNILVDKPSAGLTTVTFEKTPPMSTYLACFIISDFVAVSKIANRMDGRSFRVSVYTTKAQKQKATFALDIGVNIIEYYINLFKIDFPLPKLDMAAIPDFVSGAMENWGLVTFREARLLFDPKTTSTANKEDIVKVIGHEFAHMWFGNLVTMSWWNDLWLNEGFATYMQYKSSQEILPEYHFMDHFLIEVLHPALTTDAKLSSHPIVQKVSNPDEITAVFDVISYQKGASILRMLEDFIGSDVFYIGITNYLKRFTYRNAKTTDLFEILQQALHDHNSKTATDEINVHNIMQTWTEQMGYPIVNVTKEEYTYTLTQKRFLSNSNSKILDSKLNYKWTIPITYITSKNLTPTLVWFDKDSNKLLIQLNETVDWIKFNVNQVGYYRVNYNQSEWKTLLNILYKSPEQFSIQDRTHLIEDAFSLADAEELDYSVPMDMTLYLKSEKHYSPWYVAANKLKAVDSLLLSTNISKKYRLYVRDLINDAYHNVTWNIDTTEDHEKLNLRSSILGLACLIGHSECLDNVSEIFKNWINEEDNYLHPDIRAHVYYYGMNRIGGETDWNIMFKRFTNENDAAEKIKLMHGLAGIRSEEILKKYINLSMDENYVRSQDALSCLSSISMNPDGSNLVWDWVRENWLLLVKRYTLNDRYLGRLIPVITKNFATATKLNEIKSFFEKYPEAGAGSNYRAQALETVDTNIKWIEHNSEKINKWLDQKGLMD